MWIRIQNLEDRVYLAHVLTLLDGQQYGQLTSNASTTHNMVSTLGQLIHQENNKSCMYAQKVHRNFISCFIVMTQGGQYETKS